MKVLRFLLTVFHLFVVALLLGTTLNAFIPPKVISVFNLLSLSFPILIFVHFALIIFWIILWKKRAYVFLFLTLFLLNPIQRWVNFSSKSKEQANFKLVSFNAKGLLLGKNEIKKYLEEQNADAILLQEGQGYEGIIEIKGMKSYQISPVIVMYTNYKVKSSKALIDADKGMNAYSDSYDIDIKGKTYRFINLYLQPFQFEKSMIKMNGNSDENEQKAKSIVKRLLPTFKDHQTQVELIRNAVDNSPYPIILAGDFNAVPNSYEYYHLGKDLQDAFIKVGNGSSTSFHDYKFPIRIDYVFTSKDIIPVSYQVDRSVKLSDHYSVISTFKLP